MLLCMKDLYIKHCTKKCLFCLNPSNRYFIFQLESSLFVFVSFNHFRWNKRLRPTMRIWRSITKCYGVDSWATNIISIHTSKLIEIMLVMLTGSSVVERGFSTVRCMLRESRLSMQNTRLNQVLIVKCNLSVLRKIIPDAIESILTEVVELYKSKKNHTHVKKVGHTSEFGQ